MPVTILCVHENQRALMARSLILSIAGYDVQTAGSGDEAIRLFAKYEFDLVLAEHFAPVMNGVQLTKLMKEVEPEIQVVLLSDVLDRSANVADHVDLVLPKCMEPEQLLAALKALVRQRHPRLVPTYKKVANLN